MAKLPLHPSSTAHGDHRPPVLREGPYRVGFATDREGVRAAQRLRFEVFNLELREGLASSHTEGLDRDEFDAVCDHLLVVDERTGELVGTYRMQPSAVGFERLYCAGEFDLRGLPPDVLAHGVELGRACIAREHRNGLVLFALWRGLAAYAVWRSARYLFGCSSLTSQDEGLAWRVYDQLRRQGKLLSGVHVSPWPALACARDGAGAAPEPEEIGLPRLFRTYLRYGARVCGPPAIDRAFKTIDFLVLLDLDGLSPRLRRLFFEGLEEGAAP
jgi:putative hemolysin